jgi:hypothetical protein
VGIRAEPVRAAVRATILLPPLPDAEVAVTAWDIGVGHIVVADAAQPGPA